MGTDSPFTGNGRREKMRGRFRQERCALFRSNASTVRVTIVAVFLCALGSAAAHDRSAANVSRAVPLEAGTVLLSPTDTYLNTNKKNYVTSTTLATYTWPDNKVANAILMKFDMSALPAGALVSEAVLQLALVDSDTSADETYFVSAHKVVGKNPNIAKATGFSADGVEIWTPNPCCHAGSALAQADISPAYDTTGIDKTPGVKTWNITTMVQEWLLLPATNFGVMLNSDASKLRDRYRIFASMEHPDATLRPVLRVSFTAADATPPTVAVTAPPAGAVSGIVPLTASASDNLAVADVQFFLNGTPLSAALSASPYVVNWDTTTRSDGSYSLTAVARDSSGNVATSLPVNVTLKNGIIVLAPQDTWLGLNTTNYSADTRLLTYTWPDQQPANAILMKFDLSAVPTAAVVNEAKLFLALVESDPAADSYTVSVSKLTGRNPLVAAATGYTADGVGNWAPSPCCHNGVPLAQSDISAPYDAPAVDTVPGMKAWTVTAMVQEWLAQPSTNFGLLLNADTSKVRDRYRFFASMEHQDPAMRPMLRVVYSDVADTAPPTAAIEAPAAGTAVSGMVTIVAAATDNVGVAGVQLKLNGAPLGGELTAPYQFYWDTRPIANGTYALTATARDAAGNASESAPVAVAVSNDTTPPQIAAVNATGVTANAAAISWTTDEAADSQVEYGTTMAYGTVTALDGASVTAHNALLTGLSDGTQYHYRVRSRDQAGNLATSGDVTFTTLDGMPPSVAITAPAAGASVSGTIAVSADAGDNVAVAGVQFKLDGVNLGAEDILPPYATSWNTAGVAEGTHLLTAVARDLLGNSAASAPVTVTVSNDATPPAITAANATGVTHNAATISWTTNEAADTQVEYGTTTAYGTVTALNTALVTAHSASLAGLNDATQYHYRVRSRDQAGNLAISGALTFTTRDGTAPSVSLTAPAAGASVSGTISVAANAGDNVGVAGVQFKLDGANLGAEDTVAPYATSWNTTGIASGTHTLTAVARDTSGNSATSAPVAVTVGGTLVLSPEDTSLNINATNYSADPTLNTYTWPDFKAANAILMKIDLSSLPANAVVQDATLYLALTASDALPAATYRVAASKVLNHNPVISLATGYTADGVTGWTPNSCCHNGVPLAQSDISPAYATLDVDKAPGFKSWNITTMVQEWRADPQANFGLLLGSDASKSADHHRFFASMENPDASLRPYVRVVYTLNDDATPPLVSGVTATGVTRNAATINWTTNEAANSQVEYGLTAAYGSMTPLNGALVTAHTVGLSGLADGKQYHYRVRSRDQAGNLALSSDFTFTTPDGTAPSVSVTAPAAGATVSGTISVTAGATDNVGVAGVQFKLNGANLGTEDAAAPYSISWNTTGVPDGSHTLTAVARDAAGNVKTATAVTVNVSNAAPPPPPPAGGGLAALYPGDVGIETDPNVVFVERFDEATMTNLFGRWTDVLNGGAMSFSTDAPAGSPVGKSLTIPYASGNSGGHLYRQLSQGVDDTLYVRYYIKHPSVNNYQHTGIWMGGYNPPAGWPNPQAGTRPSGNDRFSAAAEQNGLNRFDHYNYWMGMHQSNDGMYWGNHLLNDPDVQAAGGQWMCVEQMVKLNAPVTASNGEHAIWINGVKVSHLGQGFPNGSWAGGIFTQDPSGTPFQGLQWRNNSSLNLNWIWLQVYASNGSGSFKYAHVVAAKSYIGCLASGSPGPSPTPPTVSLTAPAAGATVSGTIAMTANAADSVGVAGVQFKLDGNNFGAEDTTAPYSVSWNTATASNGSHTLTAVARNTSGLTTTSAPVTVNVSNAVSAGWPNEPAAMTLVSDWAMDQALPTSGDVGITGSGGWKIVQNAPPGSSGGWAERVVDASAPLSPSNVLDFVYPANMIEGDAPATVYYDGLSADEVYIGFWWKPSSPFDYGPNGNKIAFIFNGGGGAGGQQFMILKGDGRLHVLPEYPGDYQWRTPNVNATFVTLGQWHRIEWYANRVTGAMKWWLDGVLQGSYTNVTNSFRFDMFQFSPTWGGASGARKDQTDHYWYDHARLLKR
jgi:hypothetical protein